MPSLPRSYALHDLSWVEVHDHLSRDRRLILPLASCDQYGPHLPIGAGAPIATALAEALSREFGVLRAPLLPYGLVVASERPYAGAAGLRGKTLHRALNELLAAWEAQGFNEFILLNAQPYEPQVEAVATVSVGRARVRVIDALGIDLAHLLRTPLRAHHAGEVETSLLLHLRPELVRMEAAEDFPPPPDRLRWRTLGRLARIPVDSLGAVGFPSAASAEAGERMYGYILQKIRERVFLSPLDQTNPG